MIFWRILIIYLIIVLALIKNMRMVRLLTFIISLLIITTLSFFFPDTKQRMINDTINQLNLEKIIPNIQEEKENIEVENLEFWNDKKRSKRILAFSPHHEITYEVSLNIFYDNYFFQHR